MLRETHEERRIREAVSCVDSLISFCQKRGNRDLSLLLSGMRIYIRDPDNAAEALRSADHIDDDAPGASSELRRLADRLDRADDYVRDIAQTRAENFVSRERVPCGHCDSTGVVTDLWDGLMPPTVVTCPECHGAYLPDD